MTTELRCPFCSSEKVYSLLNTQHCKRCKNMWKENSNRPDDPVSGRFTEPAGNRAVRVLKKTGTQESRLEKRLDEYLKKYHGKFSMDIVAWNEGDVTGELFRRYLNRCVKNKVLTETKDRYGRTWYSTP